MYVTLFLLTDHENATHEDAQYSSTHSQFSYDEEEEQAKSCYGESFEGSVR